TSRSTPETACTAPRGVAYSTHRSCTSRMGALATESPNGTQGRVADLVERVVEQGEGRAQQGHAQTRCDRPQRRTVLQRTLALRPVEHRAPADLRGVAEPEELQTGRGEHRVQRGAEEVRDDQ